MPDQGRRIYPQCGHPKDDGKNWNRGAVRKIKTLTVFSCSNAELNRIPGAYKLCTFSRVMKEKGIEDAVNAVKGANEQLGGTAFTLDIYGQVDEGYVDRFEQLKAEFPEYIRFVGLVPFHKSVETLRGYFALLFPTFYPGEGFAGTLIDAMAAGVPVVASDWKYNREIVVSGRTGILIPNCDKEKLTERLIYIAQNPHEWNAMKVSTLEEAHKYMPDAAIQVLMDRV